MKINWCDFVIKMADEISFNLRKVFFNCNQVKKKNNKVELQAPVSLARFN